MASDHTNDEPVFYGLIPSTLIDYPGQIAATVFTMGCNFRCPFCHNRELALAIKGSLSEYPLGVIVEQAVRRNNGWLDGICITGGEPLISDAVERAI